jgi:hypothetical protein
MREMRLVRLVLFSALGLASGCGGCDSCFGTKQPGDDDSGTIVRPILPPLHLDDREDASAAEAGGGGAARDAAADGSSAAELPRISPPPRPKAPMPLGEFQSCSVYEKRCERACPKGACRQECDGVECTLSCKGGYCSQFCGPTATCRFTCEGGHCVQVCSKPDGCIKECAGGDCQ